MKKLVKYQMFLGEHCETTATGNLLAQIGIHLSEPMLFGLGEGLGFIFLNLKSFPLPFVGGRSKPFELTQTLCANLNLNLDARETSSKARALENLMTPLQNGQCIGLQLDSYHLDYFASKIHFAGHCVAAYGFDDRDLYVVDTKQQGSRQTCSLKNIEKARFEKGSMAAKARSWTISTSGKNLSLAPVLKKAIPSNARKYLKPQFKGMGYLGIEKLAKSLPSWLELAKNPEEDLKLAALLLEKAGTGGSVFRNFYRDFLGESAQHLKSRNLSEAQKVFSEIADQWNEVAGLIQRSGETLSDDPLIRAAKICAALSNREKAAMELLTDL